MKNSQQVVLDYANKWREHLEMRSPEVGSRLLLDAMARKIIQLENTLDYYKKRIKEC